LLQRLLAHRLLPMLLFWQLVVFPGLEQAQRVMAWRLPERLVTQLKILRLRWRHFSP
jgi:hypothetical protein